MASPFRSLYPLAQRDTYNPNELVDFTIAFDGEEIVMNSIALVGKVGIADSNGTVFDPNVLLSRDAQVGHHAYFSTITTSSTMKGLMESFTNYPRYIKMHADATMDNTAIACETRTACEGRVSNLIQALGYMAQDGGEVTGASLEAFCVKPRFCLNLTGGNIRSDVFGQLNLKLQLAPARQVLFGDVFQDDPTWSYQIHDLQLIYQTVPLAQAAAAPITMQTYSVVPMQVNSNDCNLTCYVPSGITDAVHMSFIPVAHEADATLNYLATEAPPALPVLQDIVVPGTDPVPAFGFSRVKWGINDSNTALVGFTMESLEESLYNYVKSFNPEPDRFSTTLARLRNSQLRAQFPTANTDDSVSDAYGVGLPFGGLINLGNNKFSVTLESRVTAENPYKAYLYFRSVLSY